MPVLVLAPLAILGTVFVQQVRTLVVKLQQGGVKFDRSIFDNWESYPVVGPAARYVRELVPITADEIQGWLIDAAQSVLRPLAAASGNLVLGAMASVIGFFLMLFLLFFLLRDGERMFARVVRLIPLSARRRDPLIQHLASVTRAVVYGTGLTAILQGLLVGIGFAFAGLPSPVVFGVLAAIMALLPAGGTAIVWLPAVAYLAFAQRWGGAIFLLAWGVLVSVSDNFLRPVLISRSGTVSTLVVFVGVVGGVAAFGPIGIIVGPVFLTLVTALITYADEMLDAERRERDDPAV
jgi:predicted PurR-regulated permease PerM